MSNAIQNTIHKRTIIKIIANYLQRIQVELSNMSNYQEQHVEIEDFVTKTQANPGLSLSAISIKCKKIQ